MPLYPEAWSNWKKTTRDKSFVYINVKQTEHLLITEYQKQLLHSYVAITLQIQKYTLLRIKF